MSAVEDLQWLRLSLYYKGSASRSLLFGRPIRLAREFKALANCSCSYVAKAPAPRLIDGGLGAKCALRFRSRGVLQLLTKLTPVRFSI